MVQLVVKTLKGAEEIVFIVKCVSTSTEGQNISDGW